MLLEYEFADLEGSVVTLYTQMNEKGEFALSTDGSVFWSDTPDNQFIQMVDGRPWCVKPKLYLARPVSKSTASEFAWSIIDDNMKTIRGSFPSLQAAIDYVKDRDSLLDNMELV